MTFCDTNIIIEIFKNNSKIINECEKIGFNNLALSAISAGELYHGALDKNELKKIEKHVGKYILLKLNLEPAEILQQRIYQRTIHTQTHILFLFQKNILNV